YGKGKEYINCAAYGEKAELKKERTNENQFEMDERFLARKEIFLNFNVPIFQ
ncbi:TPA: hypothetical protein SVO06_002000, partial [Streptococcus equi subsp. equi]|nr:hypothetical protein [Streptococcus equi subsp. equi]HEK9391625.1 hypothetical protein [Streptococcus equi subsp. equi]HEK9876567.1 hypothetical protein [Streptococcus equi subsp. equi]HEL0844063.1 hypothetical protein [Streptococcus equi subsp. equi]